MMDVLEAQPEVVDAVRPALRVTMLGLRGFPKVQGGIENHVENLATRLVEIGCEVEVVVRPSYMAADVGRTWCGVRFARLWAPRTTGVETFFHTLIGVLRAGVTRPDILHIHGIGPALFTPLGRMLGLRLVVTHHSLDYEREKWGSFARWLLRLGETAGMRLAHGRIVVSGFLADRVRGRYQVPVEIIPNGIPAPNVEAGPAILRSFDLTPGRYILTVARIDPVKRQLDLIAAMRQARARGWKLAIVGSADYRDGYARAVSDAAEGVGDAVLLGHQTGTNLAGLFGHAGAFAMVSSVEGQPIAVLEALSYGCPLILSDIPAHREIAPAGTRFIAVGDVTDLAAAFEAAASGAAAEGIDAADRMRIAEAHDWTVIARRTLQLYHHALTDR
ncbi:glycosyltransferase family 4 protein [Methylobacterium planeticum]|uniref:Glycosyltransferase family 4 protein n=1 Tax=Methylobacterium planeticum TaxID=2615211 RepID=A0A6N6MUF5_9HYPH|nr:glycosyltransferase family 4 protein [Methylobacterium planeticum]KAB1074052.1 glycosyltransferase family 4 protein [Methylobacterium planeticum]